MSATEKRALVERLRAQGHAVRLDEVFDAAGRLMETHVHHYLTCVVCAHGVKA